MKSAYDGSIGMGYIYLKDEGVETKDIERVERFLDDADLQLGVGLDKEGHILGIEVICNIAHERKETGVHEMRATYDPSCGMGYIYLREIKPGEVAKTIHFDKGGVQLCVDLDSDGHILGIEVFDAGNKFPKELMDKAEEESSVHGS